MTPHATAFTASAITVRNPFSGAIVGVVDRTTRDEAEDAIARLRTYDGSLTADARAQILAATAAALADRKQAFARSITDEAGIVLHESVREVERACQNLNVAAEEAIRIHGEALRLTAGGRDRIALTIHEPVGIVAAITPFNRPLNQVVVKVAPAIAANNAVVVKPSEKTPLTALAFARLIGDCGLPPNMIAVLPGGPDLGELLVAHPHVDMVTATASVETGERITRRTGVKKVLLELGGNDPLIVLDDADLERTVDIAVAGAYATAGQSCRGIKRILVMNPVADRFVALLTERTRRLVAGDPLDPGTSIGPLIDEAAAMAAERRCRDAVRDGAILVCGGSRHGALFTPAVLDHVRPASKLVTTETFAPVAPVLRMQSIDELIGVANATPYGLQAGVMTGRVDDFLHIARRLRVGAVNLQEGPQFDSPHIPFGGVKQSGVGREGMRFAIREMSTIKTVVMPWT